MRENIHMHVATIVATASTAMRALDTIGVIEKLQTSYAEVPINPPTTQQVWQQHTSRRGGGGPPGPRVHNSSCAACCIKGAIYVHLLDTTDVITRLY